MATKDEMIELFAFSSAIEDVINAWATRFDEFTDEELTSHITALGAVLDGEMDYCEFAESTNLTWNHASQVH